MSVCLHMLHLQQGVKVGDPLAPSQKPTTKDTKDAIWNKLNDVQDKVDGGVKSISETLKDIKDLAVKFGGDAKDPISKKVKGTKKILLLKLGKMSRLICNSN